MYAVVGIRYIAYNLENDEMFEYNENKKNFRRCCF